MLQLIARLLHVFTFEQYGNTGYGYFKKKSTKLDIVSPLNNQLTSRLSLYCNVKQYLNLEIVLTTYCLNQDYKSYRIGEDSFFVVNLIRHFSISGHQLLYYM